MRVILGINAYHGDVSAALVRDGRLIAAIEEERFRRVKHWAGFPRSAIEACLEMAGINPRDVEHFAISRNPRAHLWRKAFFALRTRPGLGLVRDRLRNREQIGNIGTVLADTLGLERQLVTSRIHWIEHHLAHLASAYYVSPFGEAAVCAIDGFGDFVSTSWAIGRGRRLKMLGRVYFPHSLGLFYLAITQYLGFTKYGDEYKVMGLAAYGEPAFAPQLRQLIRLLPDGDFEINLSYFRHHAEGVTMTWNHGEPKIGLAYTTRLEELLGPARSPDSRLEPRHVAVAASLQLVFEEAAFHVLRAIQTKTRLHRLCLAGGCAMNSVANGKIREHTAFREVFVQPAAGDNGTSLGAAFYVARQLVGEPRHFVMGHSYWGPAFTEGEIVKALNDRFEDVRRSGCSVSQIDDEDELCRQTAVWIAEGKVVGWFQGRMEWGPRALGNRSILADPRRADMREIINTKIKLRETFRPFAPSILEESLEDYFVGAVPDPFMIQVYLVRAEKRAVIPAVTHVDGSGRLQTVSQVTNPLYWSLIKAFERETGVPVLLNTSFNENEPIVHRPEEALDCFFRTQMDALVMSHWILKKDAGAALEARK
jgi:carbamoyltransferase